MSLSDSDSDYDPKSNLIEVEVGGVNGRPSRTLTLIADTHRAERFMRENGIPTVEEHKAREAERARCRIPISLDWLPKKHDVFIAYGTAGFRTKAYLLEHVMTRVGILACLRSMKMKAIIGAMVTASHNPVEDNGVKLVDPMGEMLEVSWEKYATDIANCPEAEVIDLINDIISKEDIDTTFVPSLYVGHDTRESCGDLIYHLLKPIYEIRGNCIQYDAVTTPVLHYMVGLGNSGKKYERCPLADEYYDTLATAFNNLLRLNKEVVFPDIKQKVFVDCANGVGAMSMMALLAYRTVRDRAAMEMHSFEIVNGWSLRHGSPGILNHKCGADFVKTSQRGPEGIEPVAGARYASFDGDADRLIYYYYDAELKFHMFDGDRIAVLFAQHLGDLVKVAGLSELRLGLVQSAYANGSSTNYIQNVLAIPVTFTPTGVKHLHHEAQQYDIGVYFEANGHGTVLFSQKARDMIAAKEAEVIQDWAVIVAADKEVRLRKMCPRIDDEGILIPVPEESDEDKEKRKIILAKLELAAYIKLINPYVGDAVSDMLAVEAILFSKGWTMEDWNSLYTDLPNRLLTVKVQDRNVITTTDAERVAVTPVGLQEGIIALCAKYKNGRSFVRPSGTEDIVRVYAEADTRENADLLGAEVSLLVHQLCDGAGDPPKLPA